MAVQNVSQYNSLYNQFQVTQLQNVSLEMEAKEMLITDSSEKESSSFSGMEMVRAPKSADLENISLTFLSEDDFSYIGKNSDIHNLDVMQAVSDMQKDSVLQQYHTFVGAQDLVFSSEDGMVFLK